LQAAEVLLVSRRSAWFGEAATSLRPSATYGCPAVRCAGHQPLHRHDEVALEKVEQGMKVPVFARAAEYFKQVSEANVRGDSLKQDGRFRCQREFNKMAARLAGLDLSKQAKKSRLGQFFAF